MHIDADTRDIPGIKRRKLACVDGRDVGRMIGACTRSLEPRHVCKIGKFTARFECGDEGRKFVAIGGEQGRARRLLQHEDPRHRGEEFFAHDFLDHRETAFERFPQAHHHIVAVDGKAPCRNRRIMSSDAARYRLIGVQQRFRKRRLER